MPFNRAFREKQRELKAKSKNKRGDASKDGTGKGARSSGEGPFQDSQDIHCKGMTTHITGKLDKYGNWRRD